MAAAGRTQTIKLIEQKNKKRMPSRKQGLRARVQRHAAVGDDGRLVFDHPAFRDLLDSHATCPSPHVEKDNVSEEDARNGFDVPVIVRKPHKNNLGLRMPKQSLTPRDVANATCPKSLIPILDVKLQTSQKRASLSEWCQYWERMISASRCVEAPSRRRRDSSPREEAVGGLIFDFEPFRTASRPRFAQAHRARRS